MPMNVQHVKIPLWSAGSEEYAVGLSLKSPFHSLESVQQLRLSVGTILFQSVPKIALDMSRNIVHNVKLVAIQQ